eukprot:1177198-Prorocentrum_minimum.AAC.2
MIKQLKSFAPITRRVANADAFGRAYQKAESPKRAASPHQLHKRGLVCFGTNWTVHRNVSPQFSHMPATIAAAHELDEADEPRGGRVRAGSTVHIHQSPWPFRLF